MRFQLLSWNGAMVAPGGQGILTCDLRVSSCTRNCAHYDCGLLFCMERRAHSKFTVDIYLAFMFFNDTQYDSQPQSRSFIRFFCRKIRVEYFFTSHLKKRILVQNRDGGEIKTGPMRDSGSSKGQLKYSKDFNIKPLAKTIEPKEFFELACTLARRAAPAPRARLHRRWRSPPVWPGERPVAGI